MKKLALILFILSCLIPRLYAQTPIKAEVDKKSLSTGETLTYTVILNSSGQNLPRPEFPKFEGFAVIAQTQSSSLSFGQGKMNSSVAYAFVLAPEKTGKLEIAPARIKIKDATYATGAFEIEVKEGKVKPKPAEPRKLPIPRQEPSQQMPQYDI